MPGEITKEMVLRTLDDANYALKKAVNSCKADQDFSSLPEAFPVIAKHLPILSQTLESMSQYLADSEETNEIKQRYAAICRLAEMCRKQAGYLQDIFIAIAANNAIPKLEQYRKAVANSGGIRIESIIQNLLEQAVEVAVVPLVGDALIKELQGAREEVAALGPSLKEDPKEMMTLNNYGEGNQFYHGGTGHQNHCAGGIQITGDGATNHIAADRKREPAN
ncbi:hypothetical protein F5Y13DRAFT_10067 [Hypoxylon sp. FL1857]|nr:hypothetical protein F5Y13DRAFT_10067 [Hypoxylon sp. FL1857]